LRWTKGSYHIETDLQQCRDGSNWLDPDEPICAAPLLCDVGRLGLQIFAAEREPWGGAQTGGMSSNLPLRGVIMRCISRGSGDGQNISI
jgi:hypothetical protein